jgi:hypothetical protein
VCPLCICLQGEFHNGTHPCQSNYHRAACLMSVFPSLGTTFPACHPLAEWYTFLVFQLWQGSSSSVCHPVVKQYLLWLPLAGQHLPSPSPCISACRPVIGQNMPCPSPCGRAVPSLSATLWREAWGAVGVGASRNVLNVHVHSQVCCH